MLVYARDGSQFCSKDPSQLRPHSVSHRNCAFLYLAHLSGQRPTVAQTLKVLSRGLGSSTHTMNCPAVRWAGGWIGIPELHAVMLGRVMNQGTGQ
jgi:hypothetical protein